MTDDDTPTLRVDLRAALRDAMRARDAVVVDALRTTLAAIDNAGSAGVTPAPATGAAMIGAPMVSDTADSSIAGAVQGLGAGETARREVDDAEVVELVQLEIRERLAAAEDYDAAGFGERADQQRRAAAVLEQHLADR